MLVWWAAAAGIIALGAAGAVWARMQKHFEEAAENPVSGAEFEIVEG
jgi:hypothetical protein